MRLFDINSIVSVFQVKNIDKSIEWYKKWLGEPDIIPIEGVAEYKIREGAWLQLSLTEDETVVSSSIIIGVVDIEKCKEAIEKQGIETGEIIDYDIVYVFDVYDIDNNKISFVQEV